MAVYLQLEGATGRIFEYSKEEKEGFDKHESTKGNVSYRKYYTKGLFGELLNVGIREFSIGPQITLALKKGDDIQVLQMPLYSQDGNIDNRYAESLIRFLPNMKKGESYRLYPYAMDIKDSKYKRYGVSVHLSPDPENETKGEKVVPYLNYSKNPKEDTDIPNLEWAMKAGKNRPTGASQDIKDEFLFQHLQNAVEGHLKYEGNETEESPLPEQPKETPAEPVNDLETDDYDDLPF